MTMLTINGLTIKVRNAGLRKSFPETGGDNDMSPSGNYQHDRRMQHRVYDADTVALPGQESEAIERWVTGRGMWSISFEDGFHSWTGLNVDGGFAGSIGNASQKFGDKSWQTEAGLSMTYRIPVLTRSNDWTVSLWYDGQTGTFAHYTFVSRGGTITRYKNGVANGSALYSFITVANPQTNVIAVTLIGKNETGTDVGGAGLDDLVLCNWPWTAEMAAAHFNLGVAFPDCPKSYLSGDVRLETSAGGADPGVTVIGSVTNENYEQGQYNGAWNNNLRTLSLKFEEVRGV